MLWPAQPTARITHRVILRTPFFAALPVEPPGRILLSFQGISIGPVQGTRFRPPPQENNLIVTLLQFVRKAEPVYNGSCAEPIDIRKKLLPMFFVINSRCSKHRLRVYPIDYIEAPIRRSFARGWCVADRDCEQHVGSFGESLGTYNRIKGEWLLDSESVTHAGRLRVNTE